MRELIAQSAKSGRVLGCKWFIGNTDDAYVDNNIGGHSWWSLAKRFLIFDVVCVAVVASALPVAKRACRHAAVGALLLVLLSPGPPAYAEHGPRVAREAQIIELVGQVGGPNYGIDFDGQFLYVGRGNRLLVIDVSDPASPREHAATAPLPGTIYDMVVVNEYAYVAVGPGPPWHPGDPEHPDPAGLYIMDVSDPGAPTLVGFADTPGSARSVDVDGGLAVVAQGDVAGLQLVDVSNPVAPRLLGVAARGGHLGPPLDVAVRGNYAYAVYGYGSGYAEDNFGVIDLADPTAPREVAALGLTDSADRITLAHGYAYVAARLGGLRILDISHPESPQELGSILESEEKNSAHWATDVSLDGGVAYVARSETLQAIDVTDPKAPVALGVARSAVDQVVAKGGRVFGLHEEHGPQTYDCSDPLHPKLVGEIRFVSPTVKDLTIVGHRLFAVTWDSLHLADISDPTSPRLDGYLPLGGEARRVAVSANYAFIAHRDGIKIVDSSQPDAPKAIREVAVPSLPPYSPSPFDVEATRDNLFVFVRHRDCRTHVSCYDYYALHSFDITQPTTPRHLSELVLEDAFSPPITDEWDPLYLAGNLAYVASGDLYVVDVSNPSELRLVGAADTHGRSRSVMERGLTAYVADRDGLDVFDASDPSSLSHIAFLGVFHRPYEYTRDVYAIGEGVVALSRYGAIALLDTANPAEPAEVALFETANATAYDIHVSAGHAYVAGGPAGVLVYRLPILRAPFEVFLPSAEFGTP